MTLVADPPLQSLASVSESDARIVPRAGNSLSQIDLMWVAPPVIRLSHRPETLFAVEFKRWSSRNSLCSVEMKLDPSLVPNWLGMHFWASDSLSAFELQQHAGFQLSRLIAKGVARPSAAALRSLNTVVSSFARAGGPTPQLAATANGSIEVAWVAGPTAVGAVFADDGTYSVWAQDDHGDDLFDEDIDDAMPQSLHDRITTLLATMNARIQRPVPLL